MPEQISDADLKEAIFKAVKDINEEAAAKTAPLTSLSDILALKNNTDLRKLGRMYNVKYHNRLQKPELIAAIAEKLQDQELLRSCLLLLDEIEWKFFEQVADKEKLQTDKVYVDSYFMCQNLGLLQSFYFNEQLWFVVPEEIRAVYKQLCKTDFPEEKRFRDLLNNYATAAVSLYGVIGIADFIALFNFHNKRKTNMDELSRVLGDNMNSDLLYCFWKDYIVNSTLKFDNFSGVKYILSLRQDKPQYMPSKEEFLKYADPDYYEDTPELRALQTYLSRLIADKDEVLDVIDEVHYLTVSEARLQAIFDLLDSHGVVFDSMAHANETVRHIVNVQNNTRLWSNYGNTPTELSGRNPAHLLPLPVNQAVRSDKVGRNSSCPCGSGKKYKQCCGKDIS